MLNSQLLKKMLRKVYLGLVVTADGVEDGSGGFFHLQDCVAQFLQFILCSTDGGRLARAWGASERDGIEGRVGLDQVVIEMDIRQSWLDGSGLAGLADAELADGMS